MTYLETFRRKKRSILPLLFDSRLGGAHWVMVHFQQLLGTACKESLISNKALVVGTSCVCVSSLCQRSSMTDDYDLRIWCKLLFCVQLLHTFCTCRMRTLKILQAGFEDWSIKMGVADDNLLALSRFLKSLWICARARGKPMAEISTVTNGRQLFRW